MAKGTAKKPGKKTTIAAGALCWRISDSQLQVLVIHRPRYKDWSWPKGKMQTGETIAQTAVREVREEVGFTILLGRRLPMLRYKTSAGTKEVHYWAAHIPKGTQKKRIDEKEVDKAKWLPADKAYGFLSRDSDRIPLEALIKMHDEGTLESRPFIIMRHAKARSRSGWADFDGDRPLSAMGRRQAAAGCKLLGMWRPTIVVSSPWLRCISTILPYLRHTDAELETAEALTESSWSKDGEPTAALVSRLLSYRQTTVLCVHRPTIPTVFQAIAPYIPEKTEGRFPSREPYLKPGELLVLHLSSQKRAPVKVLGIERYKPFSN